MIQRIPNIIRLLVISIFCTLSINSFGVLSQYSVQHLQIYTGGSHPTSLYWQDMFSNAYNSGRVLPTWNWSNSIQDDISTPQAFPNGFTFNYDGINCNYFYVSTNGFLVLDTLSNYTITNNLKPKPCYATNTTRGSTAGTATADTAYNGSYLSFYHSPNPISPYTNNKSYSARCIAPFYSDLMTGQVNSTHSTLASDICWYYSPGNIVSGDTMVIVEWRQMTFVSWTGNYRRLWFQARLHKTSGTIEFYYQWMANQYTGNYPQNYICGLNSATWASSPTWANVFTQTTANTATFGSSGTQPTPLSAHESQNYKLVFTKIPATADIAVVNISPPIADTCGWSTSQIIVDSITNLGNTLVFSATPLTVYSKITDSVNGAMVWTALDSSLTPFTGTFTSNTTIGVQMAHTWNFSAGGQYTIKSYIKDSIHAATTVEDANLLNDTTTITIFNSRVTASADATTMCSGLSTYLHASPTMNHSNDSTYYTHYTKMTYSPPSNPTHHITSWTGGSNDGTSYVPLPFTFKYFGMNRNALFVCTNGFVEFECGYTTPSAVLLPNTVSSNLCPNAEDVIAVAWSDMRLDLGGSIYWDTAGTAPNREFILMYNGVYDSTSSTAVTAFMILHESSNLIEFQNDSIPTGSYTQGLQDSAANIAYFLSSRNANSWSATHDAYLFSSQPAYFWTASPADASLTSAQAVKQNPYVSPTITTIYTVTMNGGNTGYPDSIGICPKTSTITITITPGLGPVPVPSGLSTTLCQFTNTYFKIPAVTNASSYYWDTTAAAYHNILDPSYGGAHITSGQGTDSITLTLGAYSGWLKITAYFAGCGTQKSDSVYITVVQGTAGQWVGGIDTGWFKPLNWCGGVPTSSTDVIIDGTIPVTPPHMPVINGSGAVTRNLYLDGYYDTLTISGSNILKIYGDFANGMYGNKSALNANSSTVLFTGNSSNTIFGNDPTVFNNITVNKGTDTTYVLENALNFPYPETISMTGNLTLTNGLFRLTEPTSSIQFSSAPTIAATAGLELNSGLLTPGNFSITNLGLFRMTPISCDISLGTSSGNSITTSGSHGIMDIQGGKLTVASQIIIKNGATFSFDDMNTDNYINNSSQQDTIILNKFGTTNNTQALFEVDATSNIYITDGYFIFHNPNSGTGYDLRFSNGSGTKFLDVNNSSTFQFGEASTTSSSATFKVVDTAALVFNNITINPGGGHDTLYLYSPVSLNSTGYFSLNSGILKLNKNTLTLTNSLNSALSRTTGSAISEDSLNGAAIKWNIAIDNSVHCYPFANNSGTYIPFYFQGTSGTGTYVKVATYAPTNSISHKPYPSSPTIVTHIRDLAGVNDSAYMVNRFWQIDADTSIGHPTATMYFKYAASEAPAINNTTALNAQRWYSVHAGWFQPTSSQTWVGGASDSVRTPNISNFSPWTLAQTGHALPIELLNFTAIYNGLNVDLNWTTSSEINNDYFTVLRTMNTETFDFIATVAGAGNSDVYNYYHAVDYAPLNGLTYYQLKQTDYDGHSTLSGLQPIIIGKTIFEIKNIYSIHDESTIHVLVNDNESENITISLVDVLGNVLIRQKASIINPSTDIKLNVENLPHGIYFITVQNDSKFLSGKVIY